MPEPHAPSSFSLWLEEALTGWVLPLSGLALLAAAVALYFAGLLPEGLTAAVMVALATLAAAAMVLRAAVTGRTDRGALALSALAAAGILVVGVPALTAVAPGRPLAEGDLSARGGAVPLPAGLAGRVRLLVRATLPAAGAPVLSFTIGGTIPPAQGHLERTYSYARVGRGGRAAVAHDHSATYLETRLAGQALVLERLSGEPVGALHVAVYRDWVPLWLHLALAIAVLVLAAVAEARLRRGGAAALAGMALAFGILVAENATPASAVGTTFGSILLGGLVGALAGGIAGVVARRLIAPAPERLPARTR